MHGMGSETMHDMLPASCTRSVRTNILTRVLFSCSCGRQWQYVRMRGESALAGRERAAFHSLEPLWLLVRREEEALAEERRSLRRNQMLATYTATLDAQHKALCRILPADAAASSSWHTFQDKYAKINDAAQAATALLLLYDGGGSGASREHETKSPDPDALLACMEACSAWLAKTQDSHDEPMVKGVHAVRRALVQVMRLLFLCARFVCASDGAGLAGAGGSLVHSDKACVCVCCVCV